MKAINKKELYILKAAIKGFAVESQNIRRKEIIPNSHERRWAGWHRKRELGNVARWHLLTSSFLQGKKYSNVEKNKPYAKEEFIARTIADEIIKICKIFAPEVTKPWQKDFTKEAVVAWLRTDENIFIQCPESKTVIPITKALLNFKKRMRAF